MTIEVYTKPGCVQCRATERDLRQRGIPFERIDVSVDDAALFRITALGHRQAPVVVADGAHWSGYRPDLLAELAGEAAER
jgi:glutaredoxin-like protein NrdH